MLEEVITGKKGGQRERFQSVVLLSSLVSESKLSRCVVRRKVAVVRNGRRSD